jgi:microcystin-dependent protein
MDASDTEDSIVSRVRARHRLYGLGVVAAAALALYTLAGFLLVPALARRALDNYVMRLPGVTLQLQAVSFNPFTLRGQLRGLELRGEGNAALAGFRQLTLAISPSSLWQRGYALRAIVLLDPTLDASIDRNGRLNLLALKAPAGPSPSATSGSKSSTPALRIDELRISGARVHYEDRSRATPFATTLTPINFVLSGFRTRGAADGHFQFSAHASSGESLMLSGVLSAQPLSSSGQFRLRALQAATVASYLGNALPVMLRAGEGELAGTYRFNAAGQDTLSAELTALRVTGLAIADRSAGSAPPWLSIPQLLLNEVSIRMPERQIRIGSLALQGPKLSVAIEPDGSLSLARLLPAATPSSSRAAGASPAWTLTLAKLVVDAAHLSLADRSVMPAVALELAPLQLRAQGYSTVGNQPVRIDLASGIGRRGHLEGHGSLMLAPLSGSVNLDLQRFDLTALQPYIDRHTALTLYRGTLGVHGMLVMGPPSAGAQGQPNLRISGAVDLQDFAARDALTHADFVTGRAVQLTDVRYQSDPDGLQIGTVRVRGLSGRVIIGRDGSLNLTTMLKPANPAPNHAGGAPAAGPGRVVASTAPADRKATSNTPAMPIRIARVQIQGSTADFSDLSVQPTFSAAIEGLHGSIVGLSSDPSTRARVQLTGAVNRYAPVSIEGQVNVLSAQSFTDLAMSFQNIDLPLFNPYSGKFAGYSIAQGKLTTQMHYHVEKRQLNATHHIVIAQLEFGPATDSKQAVPLPIKLAAALLKDRNGVITLDLPVSGSLNDPTFRIGPLVWKVFVGLVRHIVTAPFSWLGSLFGGDGARLAYVDFLPGSAALDDTNAHKLMQLAQALAQRPQLRLQIPLHVQSAADDRAIEQAALEQAVSEMMARGAGPVPVASTAPARRAGRRKATAAPAPPMTRLAVLAALYRRQFKTAPQYPVDAVSDEQRTTWLGQQLLPRYVPHRQDRDALGLARATAVQMAVLASGQVAATRVFFAQRASGGAATGVVRMDLQLQ